MIRNMAWLHSSACRAERGQVAQQLCHVQVNPEETKCFGVPKWKLLLQKTLLSSHFSKFKPAQKHNFWDHKTLPSAPEQHCTDIQRYHFLTAHFFSLLLSPLYCLSVGWPYAAWYCSASGVLVRWFHRDPTNSVPAFPAFQCHPALAQS